MLKLNDKMVKVSKFPNGESKIEVKDLEVLQNNSIKLKYENNSDLIHLMFLKKYLDEKNKNSKLIIMFMPYSRMDRTEDQTIFTLKYISQFINNLNFEYVMVLEPHSDVTPALIDKIWVQNISSNIVKNIMNRINFSDKQNDYLFFPDAGAKKRYQKQFSFKNVLSASKERDFETGRIKKLTIEGEIPQNPFRVIIVDDLCSKGGTFMLSAQKLKELGATDIRLAVAHCEDTIFKGDILKNELITKVYTTNSILTKQHKKIDIKELF
ncbi:TPA: ribose-phosphate pyrophosphokinase [Clostridium botulinum]|nr:ribose-phosphate pyrophosphokinase [Clostridium botulinum]HDK7206400.1 ribose-phosphate pyrophosphokinase [Clostridium botulinum]HDK7210136.1 ribose-phosphate pyrophosphokinase [Clostridium botulinum]HDK7265585.1 ribose-phosphate pyrophosphokinase [Clostridium botulinum]HDK7269433.1 ribose-phosphate pyrophosphokinase [Clostridium botulinum]